MLRLLVNPPPTNMYVEGGEFSMPLPWPPFPESGSWNFFDLAHEYEDFRFGAEARIWNLFMQWCMEILVTIESNIIWIIWRDNLKNYLLFALKYTTCCPIYTFNDDIGTNKIFNTLDYIEIIWDTWLDSNSNTWMESYKTLDEIQIHEWNLWDAWLDQYINYSRKYGGQIQFISTMPPVKRICFWLPNPQYHQLVLHLYKFNVDFTFINELP